MAGDGARLDSMRGWLIKNWVHVLGVAELAAGLVGVGFAWVELHHAQEVVSQLSALSESIHRVSDSTRSVSDSTQILADTTKAIAKSISTKFIGAFPENLPEVTEKISHAHRSLCVSTDY